MEVSIEKLRFRYSQNAADTINDCSIVFPDGQLTCLLGPSGSGKSTILKLIAGLAVPSAGTVDFAGQVVNTLAPQQRHIGMVFQDYSLYPHLTVAANIGFPLRIAGVKRSELNVRVQAIAQRLHIEDLLNRKPRALSGGEQQRVALARALVKKPRLLLLDEPFSSLDAPLRLELLTVVRELQQQEQVTTVFVTHNQEKAISIGDELILLHAGSVQQVGSPQQLYHDPANRFCAQFFGQPQMNFVAPAELGLPVPAGTTAIGLRPEAIVPSGAPGARGNWSAKILRQVDYGRELRTQLQLGGATVVSTALPTSSVAAVAVGVLPAGCFYFAADGRRLRSGGERDAS